MEPSAGGLGSDAGGAAWSRRHASGEEAVELPASIGPYRLVQKLGEGGFGEVYAAEQEAPVRRRVAVKILKAGMDSKAVLARFEAERQALALMDHPGIAKVHDAGVTDGGRPYFVMELVAGESISDYCERRSLPLRERLALFVAVCRAVEHAHQKGIIHRDIKPSNILVSAADGHAHPRVIDFGIAKATGAALEGETLHTRAGEFLGTPEYMSPEQAATGGIDVDTRTDVYSLGVVLYRLLSGKLPFAPEKLRRAGVAEVQRVLREDEPPRPSDAARAAALEACTPKPGGTTPAPREITRVATPVRELRGDLDWIVLKAMEKERDRRYASSAALADDIERHLRDEPVLARPPSTAYRTGKLVLRHRALVAGAAAVIVALVAGLATTMTQAARARRAEREARRQADVATAVNAFLTRMLAEANPELNPGGSQITLREMVDRAARELDTEASAPPRVEAGVRHALASTYMGLGLYDDAERHMLRAIELRKRELGALSPETIDSRLAGAELLVRRGHYAAADSRLTTLGDEIATLPALPHQSLARYLLARGANCSNLGRYDEAESLLSAAVAMHRGAGKSAETELATSLIEICRLEEKQGRYDGAAALGREALQVMRDAHPGDHVQVAAAATQLAGVLERTKELAEAEELHREAVAIYTRLLGRDHTYTAFALGNLGIVLSEAGRFDEAIACQREAVETLSRTLGVESPELAKTKDNLAVSLQQTGAFDEALALRLSVLEAQRRTFGNEHSDVASALNNLGALYRLMGRWEEAIPVFEEAGAIFRKVHGEEHPLVAVAMNNLGKAYLDLGRASEAEPRFAAGLELALRVFPHNHLNTGIFRANHGLALAQLGRYEEAEREMLAAHATIVASLGADHPRARQLAADIAAFYEERGAHAETASWHARSQPPK